MIQKIEKIFYQKRITCLTVPWNVLPEKIVSDVISYWSSNMNFDIRQTNKLGTVRICCITDGLSEPTKYSIDPEMIEGFNLREPIEVSAYPIWYFYHPDIGNKLHNELVDNFDLYVIGRINCVNEDILSSLRTLLPWQSFILYGDPTMDAPEHDNRFARFLSNSCIEIKDNFDLGKVSRYKKINSTLSRLRQTDDEAVFKKISSAGPVRINSVRNYNINDIMDTLNEEDSFVCVPRRMYPQIMNEIWHDLGRPSDISQQVGDTFYVKYPYVGRDEKDEIKIVLPMNKVKFTWIDNREIMVDGHQCFLAHGKIYDRQGNEMFYLNDIVLDHSDYVLGFDNSDYQFVNVEDFEIANELVRSGRWRNLGNEVMCIIPFKIVTPEWTKYFTAKKITAYIEYIERDIGYRSDSNWYKYICNATDEVDINYTDEFM